MLGTETARLHSRSHHELPNYSQKQKRMSYIYFQKAELMQSSANHHDRTTATYSFIIQQVDTEYLRQIL